MMRLITNFLQKKIEDKEIEFVGETTKNELVRQIKAKLNTSHNHPSKKQWESFWATHNSEHNRPHYFNRDVQYYRYYNNFIFGTKNLEWEIFQAIKANLFTALPENAILLEFGCGIGTNLVQAKKQRPNIRCFGCDFSEAAVNICKEREEIDGAFVFDMMTDHKLPVKPDVVLTCGAIEQLDSISSIGNAFLSFKQYKPNCRFIHIEPIFELYDPTNPFDWLAIRYHEARNYAKGFLPFLQASDVNIKRAQRSYFGNMYNEGYMLLEWSFH